MKRFIAVFLAVVLMLSMLPLALAQQERQGVTSGADDSDSTDDSEPTVIDTEDIQARDTKQLVRAVISANKEEREQIREEIQNRLEERRENWNELKESDDFKKFNKENNKAREILKERLEQARSDYKAAKERYQNQRRELQANKEKMQNARQTLKECDGVDTEECKARMEELKQNGKAYTLRSADAILAHLEQVKSKVQENEYLTEEEATQILADLDEKIAEIEEAKVEVEAAESREEIKEAAKKINASWKRVRVHSMEAVAREANARVGGVVVKSKQLGVKLEKVLERMESNGKDVSAVQPLVDEFEAFLESAKANFESAEAKFKEARETEDSETRTTLLKEGHDLVAEAKKDLVDANAKVREIFQTLKDIGAQEDLDEVTEEEAGTDES